MSLNRDKMMDTEEASLLLSDETEKPPRKSRKKRVFWFVVPTLLLGISLVAIQFFKSTQSHEEIYITPPLDAQGTRIQFKIPERWQKKVLFQQPIIVSLPQQQMAFMFLGSQTQFSFLPFGWGRYFSKPNYVDTLHGIVWTQPANQPVNPRLKEEKIETNQVAAFHKGPVQIPAHTEYRYFKAILTEDKHYLVWVDYVRSEESVFQDTYPSIAKSIKVIH